MKLERSRLESWLRAFSRAVWCTAALGLIGAGVASAQTERSSNRKSDDRQELNILEDDPFINPAKAFETMPLLPVEVERLLPPDGREAVEAMMDYFNGASVEDLFIDGEIIRSNLDQAQRATELQAIGNVPSNKTRDANRQRANEFRRLSAIARNEGTVRVILQVSVPNIRALTQAAVGAKTAAVAAQTDVQLAGAIDQAVRLELAPLAGMQHTVHRVYQSIPFMALETSEQALTALERSLGIIGIEEDRLFRPFLNKSTKQIGADKAWDLGFEGDGFYVAILDTGLLASHEAFSGKDIVQACFATSVSGTGGDCPNGQATDTTSPDAARPYPSNFAAFEHGTHVTGIACGSSPDPGVNLTGDLWRFQGLFGVAREADIIAIQVFHKVLDCNNLDSELRRPSDCLITSSFDVLGGLLHVFSLRTTYNIAAVNMSLGGGKFDNQSTCDSDSPSVKAAIDNLRGAGIATVIASGNDGFCDGIATPGCISSAIAVGAVNGSDSEAGFSNHLDSLLDLYAPGSDIRSAVASGDANYRKNSGTSMAAPHVAGAWAVLKQQSPGASVSAILQALQSTGVSIGGRCVGTPNQKRIQVDSALFRHNGRLQTLGSDEMLADFFWTGVPGGFFSSRLFFEAAPHSVQYFYRSLLEPWVLNVELAIKNETPYAWKTYRVELEGADFVGMNSGNWRGPAAREEDPVVKDFGLFAGDILFKDNRGDPGEISILDSWIERDGENATLTIVFDEPVDPGEAFLLGYFVRDVGYRDTGFTMISTPATR